MCVCVCVTQVLISEWTFTPELICAFFELPSVPSTCGLILDKCDFTHATPEALQQLATTVPACYSDWRITGIAGEDRVQPLLDICKGVRARGEKSERLRLRVHCGYMRPFTESEASEVARCIDEQGLVPYVDYECY